MAVDTLAPFVTMRPTALVLAGLGNRVLYFHRKFSINSALSISRYDAMIQMHLMFPENSLARNEFSQ